MEKIIKLDKSVYPLEAIFSACYVFIDKVYVHLDSIPKNGVKVVFMAKKGISRTAFESIVGEFENELLNASLRMALEQKNKKIRKLIIERALFSAID